MDNEKKENELNGAESENKEASGKKQKPKSFMQTVREIDAEERRKELEEEARQNEERAKREEQRRKAYEEKLRKERLELIKLKQGIISEEDIPEEKVPEKKYSAWEKFTNFITTRHILLWERFSSVWRCSLYRTLLPVSAPIFPPCTSLPIMI